MNHLLADHPIYHLYRLLQFYLAPLWLIDIYLQDAVLKANARTKKWIVYSVVFGSIAVMGIAAILVGLYVSGNLQKNTPQEVRPEFFYWLIYEPSYCNFPKSRQKIKFNF